MRIPGAVEHPDKLRTELASFPSGGDTIQGYLARPAEIGRRGGVIIIHDAFGLGTHFPDIARRFANIGYDALATDMYSRFGGFDPSDRAAMFAAVRKMDDRQIVRDLVASAAYLRSLDSSNGKVGSIGFCAGGRSILLLAFTTSVLDAAVSCWGGSVRHANPGVRSTPERPVPPIDLVAGLSCPLMVVCGDQDDNPSPADQAALKVALEAAGKSADFRLFAGAGHAFFADYHTNLYNEAAAFRLWPMVQTFFEQSLN